MNKVCSQFLNVVKRQKVENYSACIALGRTFCYKSDLSLDKIYPNSSLKITTPPPPQSKDGKFSGYIPLSELSITYSRSSGPGGQHVNCVNTKVDVRFHVETAKWIPETARTRILEEHRNRISKEGYYIIKSDLTRSQQMNLAHALEKLRCFIREVEKEKPKLSPETLEKIQKSQERASQMRVMMKRYRSQIKNDRQVPDIDF